MKQALRPLAIVVGSETFIGAEQVCFNTMLPDEHNIPGIVS